eukprot:10654704-Lingulodinium_polyedra.AAC.2
MSSSARRASPASPSTTAQRAVWARYGAQVQPMSTTRTHKKPRALPEGPWRPARAQAARKSSRGTSRQKNGQNARGRRSRLK